MRRKHLFKLTLSAIFLSLGLVLPFLTGQLQEIGSMLLPMHLPVLFCGIICSWQYGAAVGFVLPLLRSVLFGMPPLYPMAVGMAFELCAYGFAVGLVYRLFEKRNLFTLYISLISSMLIGRIVWAIAQIILLGLADKSFTWDAFLAGAFINAFPGIIIQLVLIPGVITLLSKTRILPNGTL